MGVSSRWRPGPVWPVALDNPACRANYPAHRVYHGYPDRNRSCLQNRDYIQGWRKSGPLTRVALNEPIGHRSPGPLVRVALESRKLPKMAAQSHGPVQPVAHKN